MHILRMQQWSFLWRTYNLHIEYSGEELVIQNALKIAKSIGFDEKTIECAQEWVERLMAYKQQMWKGLLYQSLMEERNRLEVQAQAASTLHTEIMDLYHEPIACKEIGLLIKEVPPAMILERPFVVHLTLTNQTDRAVGPFEVWLSQSDSQEGQVVMVNGLRAMALPQVEAFCLTDFHLIFMDSD